MIRGLRARVRGRGRRPLQRCPVCLHGRAKPGDVMCVECWIMVPHDQQRVHARTLQRSLDSDRHPTAELLASIKAVSATAHAARCA